jgi:hypothetical protein
MNMNMVILNRDRAGSLHHEMSRCSAPPVLVKDRSLLNYVRRDFIVLTTYSW